MPRYAHVKLIAAIGNHGQLGHEGRLPWHNPDDLAHFKEMTTGGICLVGKATAEQMPTLKGRDVVIWQRQHNPVEFAEAHTDRNIWIIGGAMVYKAWLPFVSMSVITHIDYDLEVDTFMPYLWRKSSEATKT